MLTEHGTVAGSVATRQRAPFPTDLSDAEWVLVAALLPAAKSGGRPRDVDLRDIVDAALYRHRGGCSWRLLPHEFPPWQTVYTYVRQWQRDGTWSRLLAVLESSSTEQISTVGSVEKRAMR